MVVEKNMDIDMKNPVLKPSDWNTHFITIVRSKYMC